MSSFICTLRTYVSLYIMAAQQVSCIMHHYCHRVYLLSCPVPTTSSRKYAPTSETMLEQRRQRKRATETWEERATTLGHLHIAVRPCLSDIDRGRRPLRPWRKEPPHWATYTLLPCSTMFYITYSSSSSNWKSTEYPWLLPASWKRLRSIQLMFNCSYLPSPYLVLNSFSTISLHRSAVNCA